VDVHVPKGRDQKLAGTVEYYGSSETFKFLPEPTRTIRSPMTTTVESD